MSQAITDQVEAGREAYRRHAWQEAVESLRRADAQTPLDPDDLAVLAESAWFAGDPDASMQTKERAHAAYLARGESCEAARVAQQLALDHFNRLETAVGNGWLRRAARLLDSAPADCPAHGGQAIVNSMVALRMTGDVDEAIRQARVAAEVGTRLGQPSLRALGMQLQGVGLVSQGRTEEGMALIDEATVSAVMGELDPYTTGVVYCVTITVCRDLTDWQRAGEWTSEAEKWCARAGVSGFPGICRVHRAEIMHFRGSWAEAEREARRACEELRKYDLGFSGMAQYEIGLIRLRVGDLKGAHEAFRNAHELNCETEPGTSLLRLAQGDVNAACTSIKRALATTQQSTSRIRLLPAAMEIGLAVGDLDGVTSAVEELEGIAASLRTTALNATSAYARGRLLLARGDAGTAEPRLREAIELWRAVGAPYEVARARTAFGEALRAQGDEAAARLEFETAKAAFERLGGFPDARRVDALLGGVDGTAARAGDRVTRTFVFTDIVGSTPLVEALGDDAWDELLRWHDQSLRAIFDRYGGEEVRHTGDGFFVVFDSAGAAVEAAVDVQRTLAEHRRVHGFAPQVRIGLHEAEASARAMDYSGKGVHEAARIGALAGAGQILASHKTVAASATRFALSQPHSVMLKGVAEPLDVVTVEWDVSR